MYVLAPYGFDDATPAEMTNIATGKTTYMTTTNTDWGPRGPGAANDGILTTNHNPVQAGAPASCNCNWCTESVASTNAWWAIDLGSVQQVDFIYIYARSDGWSYRNAGFQIWAGNTYTNVEASQPWNSPSGYTRVSAPSDLFPGGPNIIPTPGLKARYIWYRLESLNGATRIIQLCEFQVWQKKPWVWRLLSGTYNAAYQKNAEQSGTLSGWGDGQAIRAVDGMTTNNFNQQPYTCSHTANNQPAGGAEWWMVDLGRSHDVKSLDVWGRNDCCTNRNTNIQFYIGDSRDWKYNSRCLNAPNDITPSTSPAPVTFGCTARGRYVMAVKQVVTAGLDNNFIQLCEVIVTSNRLLDMPTPRSYMSSTIYGSNMVIFGGQDASGFRSNEIRFFDMLTNLWLPPFTPLGTPPVARAFASFILLPNASFVNNAVANRIALFSGISNTDMLTDFHILTFTPCPPFDRVGVLKTDCYNGNTMCYITCASYATSANGNTPVTCRPDGTWSGIFPVCNVLTPGPVTTITASAIVNTTNVLVSWTAPASPGYYSTLTRYRAYSLTGDVLERFNTGAFPNPSKWSVHQTYNGPCPAITNVAGVLTSDASCTFTVSGTTNSYDFYKGTLRINADLSKNTWYDQRESMDLLREWPETEVPAAGSWAIETYFKLDTENIVFRDSMMAGIGLYDMMEYNKTGVLELYAGIRKDGDGLFRVGFENSINSFNNWYDTRGLTAAYVRIERDASVNPIVYRAYFKYNAADNYIRMPVAATESRLRNGGMRPQDIRPALTIRNWNGGSRSVAMYSYIRIGPITCGDPGTIRIVSNSITSAIIYGLAPSAKYKFAVQAETLAGWGTVSAPSTQITIVAPAATNTGALRLVSQGKPCSQSTTYNNDNANYGCQYAFDGNTGTGSAINRKSFTF